MSYVYEEVLPELLNEKGILRILRTYQRVEEVLAKGGAVRAGNLLTSTGPTWEAMAAVEYLERIGLIGKVAPGRTWQEGVYVRGHAWPGGEL